MKYLRCIAATFVATVAIMLCAAGLFAMSGVYNIAATAPHGLLTYWVVHEAALRSISLRSRGIKVPRLGQPGMIDHGARLFEHNCAQCHGGPGLSPADFAKGLEPGAPNLAPVGRSWPPRELYWTIAHGIKMTAMPAWKFRMGDDDLWALVAFLQKLPQISPEGYRAMTAPQGRPATAAPPQIEVEDGQAAASAAVSPFATTPIKRNAEAMRGIPRENRDTGDPARGRIALQQYACSACHVIPGLAEAVGRVGPPLTGIAARKYIAGIIPNNPQNMLAWLRHPQRLKPHDVMPNMGVTARDARDILAYLQTLH